MARRLLVFGLMTALGCVGQVGTEQSHDGGQNVDAGADAGVGGGTDAGGTDAGSTDAGGADAGGADAGRTDAGRPDGGGSNPTGSLAEVLAGDRGSSGTITWLGTSTMETAVGPDPDKRFQLPKVVAAWGTAALSLIKNDGGQIVDALYVVHGGGHGDTGYDGVLAYSFRNKQWSEVQAPTVLFPQLNNEFDTTYGENFAGTHVVSDHGYNSLIGIDSDEPGGPAIIKTQGGATGQLAIGIKQAHRFNLVTNSWSRFGGQGQIFGVSPVTVKDTKRHLIRRFGYAGNWNEIDYAASPTTSWVEGTQPSPNRGWSNVPTPCGVYDPVRDLYIGGIMMAAPNVMVVLAAGDPTAAWVELKTSGEPLPTTMVSTPWHYRSATDTFVFVDTRTVPPTGVFEVTPPATDPLTNPWSVARRSFTGTSRYVRRYGESDEDFHRWQYVPALDALVTNPLTTEPMEVWWL